MRKCALLVHRTEKDSILERLQEEAIFHISDLKESTLAKENPDLLPAEEAKPKDLEDLVSGLVSTIEYLERYAEKKSLLEGLLGSKVVLGSSQFRELGRDDPRSIISECRRLETEERELKAQETDRQAQLELLAPWLPLDADLRECSSTNRVTVLTGSVPNQVPKSKIEAIAKEEALHVEVVNETTQGTYCVVMYMREKKEVVQPLLKEIDFEAIDLTTYQGRPGDVRSRVQEELTQIEEKRDGLRERSAAIAKELQKLYVYHDYRLNVLNQKLIENHSLATRETVYLEGWIRSTDYGRLEAIANESATATVMKLEPQPGESPPIELRNRKAVRPFEMITELYGMPTHKEMDPTPLLAPFFAVFFGLCLTDAGYGVVLAVLSLLLMRKLKGGKKLLQLLFLSSLATVAMGAIVGGWFGDAFERLPIGFLQSLRSSLLVFDPMKTPLTFFGLAVGLGVVQILFGFSAALYDNLRKRRFIDALFDQLVWIVLILSAVSLLLGALKVLPPATGGIALKTLLACLGLVLLFSEREGSIGTRLGFGAYNVYSAIFILGDVLSYLRLMALGMVTGGIAMAVNIIAGIVGGVPVVGIILAAIILIGGHLFNLLINTLGAFVHTLRLQYVEFFPKFFAGGGTKFMPFGRETKYTVLER